MEKKIIYDNEKMEVQLKHIDLTNEDFLYYKEKKHNVEYGISLEYAYTIYEAIKNIEKEKSNNQLVDIEKNLHDCFDIIDETLKQQKVSKRIKSNLFGYIRAILSNGFHLGKLNENLSEWNFKYQGYGV